jgi:predicted DNA-binding protein with PD1-like motif
MMYEESHQTRRIVGAIDQGQDLVVALTRVCSERDVRGAEIRAVGTLSDVELARFDAGTKEWRTIASGEGPFEIVSISGNVSRMGDQTVVRADALLAVQAPGGQQLVFGQIRRAQVVDCEFVVDAFDDLEIARKLDPASQMLTLSSIARTAGAPAPTPEATTPAKPSSPTTESPAPAAAEPAKAREPEQPSKPAGSSASSGSGGSGASWADAAKASDNVREPKERANRSAPRKKEAPGVEEIYGDYDFNEPILGAGDILDHPKLGRCRVIKVEDDEYAHIRMSRGQIRKLALSIVDIEYSGEDDDGRNVFKVIIRR